ncbi:MAG: 4Fe-4S dicluster domain-containing protein, partial [Bdellovibrionota bacterium]
QDETGVNADYILPDNHQLETWGDVELGDGFYAIQQPTIRPMYDTRSFQLTLMTWAYLANRGPKRLLASETYHDYLRGYWRDEVHSKVGGGSFDNFWKDALQKGHVGNGETTNSARTANTASRTGIKAPAKNSGYELVLYPTVAIGDGTHANNAWLQELPDPVTKICWDNYASLSVATAKKLNVSHSSLIEISLGSKKIQLPVHVQPGLHDDVVAIAVGYGRTHAGKVGNEVGVNAYPLMTWSDKGWIASGQKVEITSLGRMQPLAVTQAHHSMEGRQIVVEAGLDDFKKNAGANIQRHHTWNIWSGHQYNGHKWAMAIDLNTCTGCSACVIACQSENNTAVVGKKYVLQGREMHWLRIDRYYSGDASNPSVVFQPVMCQHCDNAPCETVCPVLATVHSAEGLNEMIYNRCVGTRYCSNNCPYKVRRFNWFNFTKKIEKPLHLALNPDVTVRMRGVMEKCTFCVQRIKEVKNKARVEARPLKDGDIKTACQTACPAEAIVFGDMNNPDSEVAKRFKNERSYALLEEWHAAPSVRYQSKIRNNDKVPAKKSAHETSGEHA